MGRTGKWIVAVALLVIVGSLLAPVVYVIGLAGRGRAVDLEIDRIRASGEPVSAEDLVGKPIPDAENAALIYEKCFESLPRRSGFRAGMQWGIMRPENMTDDPKYWDQAKAFVTRYSGVLAMAEKAAAMSRCRYGADQGSGFGMMSHLSRARMLVRLAALQATLDAREDDTDAAVRHIELAFRVADSMKGERSFAGQRTRCMCFGAAADALARSAAMVRISENQARAQSAVIERLDLRDCARDALLGARVEGIERYASIWRSKHTLEDEGHIGAFKRLGNSVPGKIWLYSDELFFLDQMRQQVDTAYTPYRLIKSRYPHSVSEMPRYILFSALLIPSRDDAVRTADSGKANLAGTEIFLGLLAYHDRFGSYPRSLDLLKTQLNWQTPEDPFSGKPFVYRRLGKGFLLYSIGDDLKDDKGAQMNRMGPGDLVWRLDK